MSTEVGTAYVSLLPSARGFAAATSRELGRATPGIKQAGGKAGQAFSGGFSGGFLPGITTVHKAILGIGGLAIIKFGKDSVKAFSESANAENALNFAYQKFPKLADVSRQSLSDLANAMQKKTIFDDESLKSGESVLAQFKLTGKQVEQILPLVADYAAKTGRDIPNASTLVGKALLGNARALKEMGISFKATGDTGKDFATIQQLITDKVGGFAENQGKTAAGQAKILANQYNELQETVGRALVPALVALVQVLTPVLEAFLSLPGPIQAVILGVTLLSVAAVVIIPRLAAVKEGFLALRGAAVLAAEGEALAGGAATALLGPIGIIAGAIALAAGAALLFSRRTRDEVKPLGDVAQALHTTRDAYLDEIRAKQLDAILTSDNIKLLRQSSVSIDLVKDALSGNRDAQRVVNQLLEENIQKNVIRRQGARNDILTLNNTGRALQDLKGDFGGVNAQIAADAAQWDFLNRRVSAAARVLNRAIVLGQGAHNAARSFGGAGASGIHTTAGKFYLVGEKGPELWAPDAAGRVMPLVDASATAMFDAAAHTPTASTTTTPARGGDTWQVFGPSAADVAREAENLRRRRDLLAGARA